MDRFTFWQKWLTWANAIAVIAGLVIAFFGNSTLFEIHNSASERIYFEGNEMTGGLLNFKNFLFGIIGGTIAGFHLLIIFISEYAFKKKEKWAYLAIWSAMLLWFLIDSGLSIYYGAIFNVLYINIGSMLLIILPLIFTMKDFYK